MNVSIDGINFEKHNLFVRIIRQPLLWFLGFLPAKISHKFLTISKDATQISRWARTYKALELMYNFPERRRKREVSLGGITPSQKKA